MSKKRMFDKLRQIPVGEMLEKLHEIRRPSPAVRLGEITKLRDDYYTDIQFHFERVKLLEKHGWKYEEFLLELEKKSILDLIRTFNDNTQFPTELVDRAKKFFPNAKFIQASIELE